MEKNEVHIHADSIKPGENVVIIDDLLATGEQLKQLFNLLNNLVVKL